MGMKDGLRHEETEHLDFEEIGWTGKTYVIAVFNKHSCSYIGNIKWFGTWRKYCFYPSNRTVFDSKCLIDISNFMNELMKQRRNNK